MQRPDLRKCEDVMNRVMIKDNIAIITLLEFKETGAYIIVANGHLHWDPAYSDVKVIQTALLVEEMEKSATKWAKSLKLTSPIPILISGDLNSLPDSAVFEYLSQGTISITHPEFLNFNFSPYIDKTLTHKFKLKSAYSLCEDLDFTNYTPLFKGVIDYIWYDTTSIVTTGLLGPVDKAYAAKTVGFPNPHHPSDHIPLVVSMKLKSGSTTRTKVNFNNK